MVQMSIKFDFPVSNNQAEYKALIASLQLTSDVEATRLTICSDSQIVISQVSGLYQAKDPMLQKYLAKVKDLMEKVDISEFRHVPRAENIRADILSKLASTKMGGSNENLIQEVLKTPSIADPVSIVAMDKNSN